jgi:hypothetical protein
MPDRALPARATPAAESVWETCAMVLRCQERGAQAFPRCRYDAIALGPAGRYVAARSGMFDNGLEREERAAIVAALGRELAADGWEMVEAGTDPMPNFRRRLDSAGTPPPG